MACIGLGAKHVQKEHGDVHAVSLKGHAARLGGDDVTFHRTRWFSPLPKLQDQSTMNQTT